MKVGKLIDLLSEIDREAEIMIVTNLDDPADEGIKKTLGKLDGVYFLVGDDRSKFVRDELRELFT
jgi:hypothetical protein